MDCSTFTHARVAFACALTATLLLPAASAASESRTRTHYLVIYNDDAVPALTVEVAPHGTADYRQLDTSGSLQGGRMAHTTTAFPEGVCWVDLRVRYPAPKAVLTITEWNICRDRKIHLGMARRAALTPAA